MDSEEEKFIEFLYSRGLKYTTERKSVFTHVFESHKHFEADELLVDLRLNGYKVSKATIYRSLALLVESGLLREVISGERHTHYEHVHGQEHHDHLVCDNCGRIIEFFEKNIENLQVAVCKKNKFVPKSHRLQIQGLCEDCFKKPDKKLCQ